MDFMIAFALSPLMYFINASTAGPDGQFKFPHPWPPQIPPGSAFRL